MDDVTIAQALEIYNGSHIDNDLLLVDEFANMPLPNEPRRIQCLLLALCLKGKVQYTVDTVERLVKPNDILIISAGQVTDDYMFSRECSGIGMFISYDFFREIIKGVHELSQLFLFTRNHPVCTLKDSEAKAIVNYFNLLKQKVDDKGHHFRKETVQSLLTTMIYDLSDAMYRTQSQSRKQTRGEKIFTDFIKLVETNFKKERRVCWYGQQLCITPKYLSETVKAISHHTPNEWIDNYVTLEIRVQLKNSTKSIKEIAQDMNFPNQSFLGKYFKEHVGMSPSEYRQS